MPHCVLNLAYQALHVCFCQSAESDQALTVAIDVQAAHLNAGVLKRTTEESSTQHGHKPHDDDARTAILGLHQATQEHKQQHVGQDVLEVDMYKLCRKPPETRHMRQ